MAGLGIKTPVSSLQEYSVARKLVPHYELTHRGGSSHSPEFTFRVQVGDHWEEGTGRSKQDAKHRAAEKLLKTLKSIDLNTSQLEDTQLEETNEFNREPTENYVGQLKEICFNMHYPEPVYQLGEEAGPSHNKVFKIICCVSQLQEFGISKTKKQAKQQAAMKMVESLKRVGGEKISNIVASPSQEDATDKYKALKSTNTIACEDPAAFYKDNHKAYVTLHETSPTLNKVLNTKNILNIENSFSLLEEIATELKVELSTVEIPNVKMEGRSTIMTVSINPPVGAVGLNKNVAAYHLLESLSILS